MHHKASFPKHYGVGVVATVAVGVAVVPLFVAAAVGVTAGWGVAVGVAGTGVLLVVVMVSVAVPTTPLAATALHPTVWLPVRAGSVTVKNQLVGKVVPWTLRMREKVLTFPCRSVVTFCVKMALPVQLSGTTLTVICCLA